MLHLQQAYDAMKMSSRYDLFYWKMQQGRFEKNTQIVEKITMALQASQIPCTQSCMYVRLSLLLHFTYSRHQLAGSCCITA
jgi:hypothetical protein